MKKVVLIALMLTGCAKHKPVIAIDPTFQPQWNAFVAEANNRGLKAIAMVDDISIQFGNPSAACGTSADGCCRQQIGETPTITVSYHAWQYFDNNQKEALIFHELGHCILNRRHENTTENGIPISLMYYISAIGSIDVHYNGHTRIEYINELFGTGPSPSFGVNNE